MSRTEEEQMVVSNANEGTISDKSSTRKQIMPAQTNRNILVLSTKFKLNAKEAEAHPSSKEENYTCLSHARTNIIRRRERPNAGNAARIAKLISFALRIWSSSSIALTRR